MKATITFELEGSKDEIDSIAQRLKRSINKESMRVPKPQVNFYDHAPRKFFVNDAFGLKRTRR